MSDLLQSDHLPSWDPWASLTRTRLAALHANTSHPTRADIESEIYRIQTALHSFLELLNQPSHGVPLLSLHDEIIVEILLHVRDAGVRDKNGSCDNPDHRNVAVWFSFSHVCRRMRDIALNTPALWTDVSNLHGDRLLTTFLPRSQRMALSLRLQSVGGRNFDATDLRRISHLRLTLNEKGELPLDCVPLLKTLHIDTSSVSLPEWAFLSAPPPPLIPPHLYSMHITARPYPWEYSIYNGLTNLVLSTMRDTPFTLVQVQNLFARMHRVETIVIRDVDIDRTDAQNDARVELPSGLRSMRLEYSFSFRNTHSHPLLPLRTRARSGTCLSIWLKSLFKAVYIEDLLDQQVFDPVASRYPSKLRVQIILDGRSRRVALSYWYTSAVHRATPPDFEMQCLLHGLPTTQGNFLLEVQKRHIDNLSFYSDYHRSESLNLLTTFLLALSSVHTVHSTPHALACALSSVSLPLNADDAFENQLGSLHALHLQADPLDDTLKALEFLGVIARWLRAREDVGLAKVEVHVDAKLEEVLGGIAVEELAG